VIKFQTALRWWLDIVQHGKQTLKTGHNPSCNHGSNLKEGLWLRHHECMLESNACSYKSCRHISLEVLSCKKMQFFLYQISEGKGIVGKIKQKKRSERYIAKICSRDWAWLGVIAFTKTRSQTKIGVIPRDSAWFDMARGLGSLVHYSLCTYFRYLLMQFCFRTHVGKPGSMIIP